MLLKKEKKIKQRKQWRKRKRRQPRKRKVITAHFLIYYYVFYIRNIKSIADVLCTFLAVEADSVVEFNITEENKTEIECEEEQNDWSKSPVPPTPKKKQLLSSCEFKFKLKSLLYIHNLVVQRHCFHLQTFSLLLHYKSQISFYMKCRILYVIIFLLQHI